jgi:16S rRNA (uracil1498-N3)-methyltransferase
MRFYVPDLSSQTVQAEAASHFISMRVKPGEIVPVTDLQGRTGQIKIKQIHKHDHFVDFELIESSLVPPPTPKILIQAIPDKQYLDKFMEVAPLAGVTQIYFFFSDYSADYQINPERLERICVRSCEQAELAYKPRFSFLKLGEIEEVLASLKPVVLHTQATETQSEVSLNCCLVGPEGGWSQKEIENFKQIGLPLVSLGQTVWPAWLAGFSWFVGRQD